MMFEEDNNPELGSLTVELENGYLQTPENSQRGHGGLFQKVTLMFKSVI